MDCEVTVNRHDMYISLYISLVLGELTPSQYTDMLFMTLGEPLTGVSNTQPAKPTHAVLGSLYEPYRGLVSYRF